MTGHFEDADQPQLASRLLAEQAVPDIRLLKAYTRRKQAIARTIRLIRARLSHIIRDFWLPAHSKGHRSLVECGYLKAATLRGKEAFA